jgi:hypothetical protein
MQPDIETNTIAPEDPAQHMAGKAKRASPETPTHAVAGPYLSAQDLFKPDPKEPPEVVTLTRGKYGGIRRA